MIYVSSGQAIWIDENVRFGKTESCSTFNNPPLCENRDFEIQILEVYGFEYMKCKFFNNSNKN